MPAESVQGTDCEQLPRNDEPLKTASLAKAAAAPFTSPWLIALKYASITAARSDWTTCCACAGAVLP
jgi:hypothetical protein